MRVDASRMPWPSSVRQGTLEGTVSVNVASNPLPSTSWDRRPGEVEEALVKAARTLTSHLDVDGACGAVLDAVENVFGATSSWILLYDTGIRQLRTVCSRGRGSDVFSDLAIPPDVGILGLAFTSRHVVFVPNVKDDDRWFDAPRVHEAPLQSVFMVPLMSGSDALGVVGLDSPCFDADRPPGDADIARLEALAAQAAIAISNARLYSASEEDRRRLRSLLQEQHRLRSHVTHLEEHVKVTGAFKEIVGESSALKERGHAGGARRSGRHDDPPAGRNRQRQGTARAIHPRAQQPEQGSIRARQLCGPAGSAGRERALRARERRLHRGHRPQAREIRNRPSRNHLPRRDRRPAEGGTGQAPESAARPPGATRRFDALRSRSMSGWSPPRIKTSNAPSAPDSSAKTCTTG